jgi:ribosome biogenesis GTPase A
MKQKNNKSTTNESEIELTPDEYATKGINWYPGHMARAIREIKEKLSTVDIVFEIRDARAPLASGNKGLESVLRQKSHLILLNKANLASPGMIQAWSSWFEKEGIPFMFLDCFDKGAMKKALAMAKDIVRKKRLESNPNDVPKNRMRLMIIGLPNTGKSTIINQLAGKTATKVADKPGQTQTQQLIVIDKDLDLLDTPGVMPITLPNEEHGLWLSALNAIPDDVAGVDRPSTFLLNHFKLHHPKELQERYKLDSLEMSAEEMVEKIAVLRGCLKQKGLIDHERVYKLILNDFRKGDLGKCCFEAPPN